MCGALPSEVWYNNHPICQNIPGGRIDDIRQLTVDITSKVDVVFPRGVGGGMFEERYRFRDGVLTSEGGRMDKHGREVWWCRRRARLRAVIRYERWGALDTMWER